MSESKVSRTKRRKIRISHLLFLLLLVGAGAFTFYRLNLKKKLQERKDSIRAVGYPVTLEELNDYYSIPEDAENAAYFILDAIEYYLEPEDSLLLPVVGQAELPARTEPLTIKMLTDISVYLKDNQKSLELLHETLALEYSRYPINLTLGIETLLKHLSGIRQSVKLLALAAIYDAEYQKSDEVIESIETIFSVSRSLSNEPIIISQLVHASTHHSALSSLERIINRIDFTDEQLIKLQELITNNADLSGMTKAFIGERCQTLSILENPTILNSDIIGGYVPPAPILEAYIALGLADREAITFLDIMDQFIQAFKLPHPERNKAADIIEAEISKTFKIHYILKIFMPAFGRIVDIDSESIAGIRIVQATLAVQRYRLAEGKLPEQLKELVPKYIESVPEDPFDGKELRYKELNPGFVIYSIGEDLSDDNGTEEPVSKIGQTKSRDITFFVER
ncbi:hypothetical protein ACFLZ8_04890 [Planctomycetota bacterium]